MKRQASKARQWAKSLSKKQLLVGVGSGVALTIVIVQLLYPTTQMVPWASIDGLSVGMQSKASVARELDKQYAAQTIALTFGDAKNPHYTPTPAEFGLTVSNTKRLEEINYPWYLRLVPSSLLWAQLLTDNGHPSYRRDSSALNAYLESKLGKDCKIAPVDASARVANDKVVAIKEESGGICDKVTVTKSLQSISPTLQKKSRMQIAMKPLLAHVTTQTIQPIIDSINAQLAKPLVVSYDAKTETLDAKTVRGWLTFSNDNGVFDIGLDAKKAESYLQEKLGKTLERAPGLSKVATYDFIEVSRVDGQVGRKLDTVKTLANLKDFLLAKTQTIPAGEQIIQPQVQYTRSYSNTDTGLSALIKNYADSHPGTYGVSMVELDGKRRRAVYNDTQKFTTASTYKVYVAFSVLKRIESGEYKWSDQIAGGRNLEKCFDDMIVKSDNACAEAFVAKIGYKALTVEAQTIVSATTTFLDTESYKTTAGDLTTFMASLATGQIPLSTTSQGIFLNALKRNVYRQGVPAGANGPVADKVGFLDSYLHDAAIVYSPSGIYALSIMTNNSSWSNIAELTRQIEALRMR